MRMRYVAITIVLMLTCNVRLSSAGSVTIPNTFKSGTKAMASEVNANFKALETEVNDNDSNFRALETKVNDNDSRIADLEGERSYTVFALGEALQFLTGSGVTVEDILAKAQAAYSLSLSQYTAGVVVRVDEICQWSKRWQDIAYLAASDDAGRLTALTDHLERMESVYDIAEARFIAGVVSEVDPLTVEYYLLSANALVEGFNAKTENSQ